MENTKVNVKIYSQEYKITGNKSREHIIRVTDYVDNKMKEIGKGMGGGPVVSVAVLAAVNVADDYFTALERFNHLEVTNQQRENETKHYEELWEEAKKNHVSLKEQMQQAIEEKEATEKAVKEKEEEIKQLREEISKIESSFIESSGGMVSELEAKYKDLESSFFDIQMENTRLKGEIDRFKKKAD